MAVYTDDTVHHDHVVHDNVGNNSNSLVGLILAVIIILALLYFGLPILRGAYSAPQVNIPSKGTLDVNVNQK